MTRRLTFIAAAAVALALAAPPLARAQENKNAQASTPPRAPSPLSASTHVAARKLLQLEQQISGAGKHDPALPGLHLRLAELRAQKMRYWRAREAEANAVNDARAAKYKRAAETEQQKALQQFKLVADTPAFVNYRRMDKALFVYAYTLQAANHLKEARNLFMRLIKDYPSSKHVADACLALAEYYFDRSSMANALQFYDKVIQFRNSPVRTYAMYKKGWAYFNLSRHQEALETFYLVHQATRKHPKQAALTNAARKDFVRAYAEIGRPRVAYQAFSRMSRVEALNMLEQLGNLYLDQGSAARAIYVYRKLIGLKPRDPRVCDWQHNVVQSVLMLTTKRDTVKEVENLVKLGLHLKAKGLLATQCLENGRDLSSELARIWHNEYSKTLNIDTLANSHKLYELHIKSFPHAKDIGEMRYYYAELLWARAENEKAQRVASERWMQAAQAFDAVANDPSEKRATVKEARAAAALARKNAATI